MIIISFPLFLFDELISSIDEILVAAVISSPKLES